MKVVIIGAGGLARDVLAWFGDGMDIVGFSTLDQEDFYKFGLPGKCFPDDITPTLVGTDKAILAIGSPDLKEKLYYFYRERGFVFPVLLHSSAMVAATAMLEEGCVITPKVLISANCSLGKCVYVNYATIIGHDARVGDFCQINTSVIINGADIIGNKCLIGGGTCILQGLTVCDEVTTALGAVLMANVRRPGTMFGNPAKRFVIKK